MIVDDFSRFTWVMFLAHKDETFSVFTKFYRRVSNEKGEGKTCFATLVKHAKYAGILKQF